MTENNKYKQIIEFNPMIGFIITVVNKSFLL